MYGVVRSGTAPCKSIRRISLSEALRNFLFTSESVTEGHPDKIADQISDAVLDEVMRHDPKGRVACETLITTGVAVVAGSDFTGAPRLTQRLAEIRKSNKVDFLRPDGKSQVTVEYRNGRPARVG